MSWHFSPYYSLRLYKVNPLTGAFGAVWELTSMISATAMNVVQGAVGQASLVCSDFDQRIMGEVQPHPMDVVVLLANSRYDTGTLVELWTGCIDSVHTLFDPAWGTMVQLDCSVPYKYFEIVNQTPAQVLSLATAYLKGVSAKTVLQYAARQVGYPGVFASLPAKPGLRISDQVTIGEKTLDIASQDYTSPDQQSWSAVLQAMVGQTATELFCDERGNLIFRDVQLLVLPDQIPVVPEEDIIGADLIESDKGVVTQVRVKWAYDYYYSQDGLAPRPNTALSAPVASMERQLKQRILVVDHPWIQDQVGADYLAQMLLILYAANTMLGTLTMPCDPRFKVGSLCAVPSLRPGAGMTYYYINGITYNLRWNGTWLQTLALVYGRSPRSGFPYVGTLDFPRPVVEPVVQGTGGLDVLVSNPRQLAVTFALTADSTQTNSTVSADGLLLPAGSLVRILTPGGDPVGQSPNGEYTVVATQATATPPILGLSSTGGQQNAVVVIVRLGPSTGSGATTNPPASSAAPITSTGSGRSTTTTSTGSGTPTTAPAGTVTLAQQALDRALTQAGGSYALGTQGDNTPPTFDCSGLVHWAYAGLSYPWPSRLIAGQQYFYFLAHGATEIALAAGQPGDILLFGDVNAPGNQHIGFLHTIALTGSTVSATVFSAMNPDQGIADCPVDAFLTEGGSGLTHVLRMSGVTTSS